MLTLDNSNISIFRRSIGKKLGYISSSKLEVIDAKASCYENLKVFFIQGLSISIKAFFFENESGVMFHDYTIGTDVYDEENSKYYIHSSPISKVEIYGRVFNPMEFVSFPDLFLKYKRSKRTDDAFIFLTSKGTPVMIVFHDYFPTIEVHNGAKSIEEYFKSSRSVYDLHHVIE